MAPLKSDNIPPGTPIIDDPRTHTDLVQAAVQNLFFWLFTYGHFCSLINDRNAFHVALKILAFGFFPNFALVQLLTNLVLLCYAKPEEHNALRNDADTTVLHAGQSARKHPVSFFIAALVGVQVPAGKHVSIALSELDPKRLRVTKRDWGDRLSDIRWLARLGVLVLNASFVCISFITYVKRLQIRYDSQNNVAALGLDHRIGQWNGGSLVILAASIVVHIQGLEWELETAPSQEFLAPILDQQRETLFAEILFAFNVQTWFNSFSLDVPTLLSSAILARLFYGKFGFLPILFYIVLIWQSRRGTRDGRNLIIFFRSLALIYTANKLVIDIAEVTKVQHGEYTPFNYRWAEKVNFVEWWQV